MHPSFIKNSIAIALFILTVSQELKVLVNTITGIMYVCSGIDYCTCGS